MSFKLILIRTSSGDSPTVHYDRERKDEEDAGSPLPIGIQLQNQTSRRVRELDPAYDMLPGHGGIRLAPREESPRALVDIHEDRVILRLTGRYAAIDPEAAFASLWRLLDAFPENNGFAVVDPQHPEGPRIINRHADEAEVRERFARWLETHEAVEPPAGEKPAAGRRWWSKLLGSR